MESLGMLRVFKRPAEGEFGPPTKKSSSNPFLVSHSDGKVTSSYHGVTWYKASSKWQARLCCGRRQFHLGYFTKAEDAARAYDRAMLMQVGSKGMRNCQLNFPNEAAATLAALQQEALEQSGPIPLAQQAMVSALQAGCTSLVPHGNEYSSSGGSNVTGGVVDLNQLAAHDSAVPTTVEIQTQVNGLRVIKPHAPTYSSRLQQSKDATGNQRSVSPTLLQAEPQQINGQLVRMSSSEPDAVTPIAAAVLDDCSQPAANITGLTSEWMLEQAGKTAQAGLLLDSGEFVPTGVHSKLQLYEYAWDGSKLDLKRVLVGCVSD